MSDLVSEVVDDDVGLLRQVVLVQADELGDGRLCPARVVLGVIFGLLLDVPVRLIRRVVGEHIVDVALLDGLSHRVQAEWLVRDLAVGVDDLGAEHLQRLCLGRRGEGKEADVFLTNRTRTDLLGKLVLYRIGNFLHRTELGELFRCQRFFG